MSKYFEFKEALENISQRFENLEDSESNLLSNSFELIEEILLEFKTLEDNLEWRKKVEAKEWGDDDTDYFESNEEREEWNEFFKHLIEKSRKK